MVVFSDEEECMSTGPTIRRVAVVLFNGFTVLDVYGPVQAFASCRVQQPDGTRQPLFELFSMAEQTGVVKPGEGPSSYAEHTFMGAPEYDILLIPGGFGTRAAVNDRTFLKHLAEASRRAEVTTTVCTGSALLARTGLLDGRPATSNKIAWDWVVQQGPRVRWIRRARWVDDGAIITSSGVSAGIDMALGLIARLHGRDMALASARNMEYLWHADAADDPFA
jgi:transcriptional regulator GlxA family with amidase domain